MFENIPKDLKFNALWCCWKLTEKGKIPFDVIKKTYAKSNNEETFYPFMTVQKKINNYYKIDENGKMLGGLGLGIFNGYSAIDIDHCIDENGKINELAKDIIDYVGSYTEVSPSKTGIRIIFKTQIQFDKNKYYINKKINFNGEKIGLEIYIHGATNKFVTITGNSIYPCDVKECDITYILDKYMLRENIKVLNNDNQEYTDPYNIDVDDIERFTRTDTKLFDLWNNNSGNPSEQDLGLLCKLAFYTNKDYNKMIDLFEQSPYFKMKDNVHLKKWEREDYKKSTVGQAINLTVKTYKPSKKLGNDIYKYGLNDTGNAHRFIDTYGENLRYNVEAKMWMFYNGKYWQMDSFNNVKNLAEELIEQMKTQAFKISDDEKEYKKEFIKNVNRLCSSKGKEAMLKEAQHLNTIPVVFDDFDKDQYLLNCNNGIVDLKTGKLIPHNKEFMLSKSTHIDFNDKKSPKLFLKTIYEIYQNNNDLIDYVLRVLGYCLSGDMMEQCLWFFNGDGSNGKSLLLELMVNLLGDYSTFASAELLLDTKNMHNHKSELATLKNKRLVVLNEFNQGNKLDIARMKDLVSGNSEIVACFKYQNEFTFKPNAKIIVTTNNLPNIPEQDYGTWRRIKIVEHKKVFSQDEIDKELAVKLKNEYSEILGLLVSYFINYYKTKSLNEIEEIQKNVTEYKSDMDVIGEWLENCCDVNTGLYCSATDLYNNYYEYCNLNHRFVLSSTAFGKYLAKKFDKARSGKGIIYKGITTKIKNYI